MVEVMSTEQTKCNLSNILAWWWGKRNLCTLLDLNTGKQNLKSVEYAKQSHIVGIREEYVDGERGIWYSYNLWDELMDGSYLRDEWCYY